MNNQEHSNDFNENEWYDLIHPDGEHSSDTVDELIFKDKDGKEHLAIVDYAKDGGSFVLCELEKLPEGGRKMSDLLDGEEIDLVAYCTHGHARGYEDDAYANSGITPETGVNEIALGGLAGSGMMPNTKPALNTYDRFDAYFKKVSAAEKEQNQEVRTFNMGHFCVSDWKSDEGNRENNLDECKKGLEHPRCMGLKIYPAAEKGGSVTTGFGGSETHQRGIEEGGTTDLAAQACLEENKTLTIHCETPGLSQETGEAERDYIKNIVLPLAKRYPKLKLVVAHVTLKSTVLDVIRANMVYGSNIHMEFTADHLFSNKDDIKNVGKRMDEVDPTLKGKGEGFMECFPQVRGDENPFLKDKKSGDDNRDFLGRCMKMATRTPYLKIMLGTDHAPHPQENKLKEKASRGIPSYRDCMRIYAEIAKQNGITIEQFKQFCSGTALDLHGQLRLQHDLGHLRSMTLVHKGMQKIDSNERREKSMNALTALEYIKTIISLHINSHVLPHDKDTSVELDKKINNVFDDIGNSLGVLMHFNSYIKYIDYDIESIESMTYDEFEAVVGIMDESETKLNYGKLPKLRKLRGVVENMKTFIDIIESINEGPIHDFKKDNDIYSHNLKVVKNYILLVDELDEKAEKENIMGSHHYDGNVISPYKGEYTSFTIKKRA